MRKIRKTLHVRARKNSAGGKFQSEMEFSGGYPEKSANLVCVIALFMR